MDGGGVFLLGGVILLARCVPGVGFGDICRRSTSLLRGLVGLAVSVWVEHPLSVALGAMFTPLCVHVIRCTLIGNLSYSFYQ